MTQEQITENNKLIAEFICDNNPYTRWNDIDSAILEYELYGVLDCIEDGIYEKHFFSPDEMDFHSSWNWLIPVVQKIGKECVDTECGDLPELFIQIKDSLMWDRVEECQQAVVEFIKWYNENKEA